MSRPTSRIAAPMMSGPPATMVFVGLALMLLVPAPLLDAHGVGYTTSSGAVWEKVHPGSDLILLGYAWALFRTGHPVETVLAQARRFPGAVAFLCGIVFLVLYIIKVQQAPFTPLIDTFFMPLVLFLMLADCGPKWSARLETGLHVFVAANAILGIVEYLSGWRLMPSALDLVELASETGARATGVLGHSLASAAFAGLYAIVVGVGGGRRLPGNVRLPMLGLQLIALAAFGGRTALVITILCLAGSAVAALYGFLAGRKIEPLAGGVLLLTAPLVLAGLASVAAAGFFDGIQERFANDNGSAVARAIIFNLFGYMSWQDLLLGPNQDYLGSLLHLEGIEVGIESFWLGFIFYYGLLPSLLFFAALTCFMIHVMRRSSPLALIPLGFFTAIISTSITLSGKSTILAQFILVVVILLPPALRQPWPRIRAARSAWALS